MYISRIKKRKKNVTKQTIWSRVISKLYLSKNASKLHLYCLQICVTNNWENNICKWEKPIRRKIYRITQLKFSIHWTISGLQVSNKFIGMSKTVQVWTSLTVYVQKNINRTLFITSHKSNETHNIFFAFWYLYKFSHISQLLLTLFCNLFDDEDTLHRFCTLHTSI